MSARRESEKVATFLRTLLQANYYGVKVELRSHLRALRAALTVFAQEHIVSTGVEVEGPFQVWTVYAWFRFDEVQFVVSRSRRTMCPVTKCRGEERALRLSCFNGGSEGSEEMLISTLCGHLPPATLTPFFTDATGGYPGGVLEPLPSFT